MEQISYFGTMGDDSYGATALSRFQEAMSRPSTKLVSTDPFWAVEIILRWFRWHQAGAQVAHERLFVLFYRITFIHDPKHLPMFVSRPITIQTVPLKTMRVLVPTPLRWLK